MNNQIEFSKPGKWVMRITADRRIEVNENVTVTEAAQTVLEALQTLLNQPEQRKPLSDDMVHRAMIALNTASCKELEPTFDEMKSALEAAHGTRGEV
jgi:polyphosphate kinase